MKKIVLVSGQPVGHISYLHKLCEETGCEVEAIISGYCREYYEFCKEYYGKVLPTPYFYNTEYYERMKKEFVNANIIHSDMEKFNEYTNSYVNKENTLLLAEIEYAKDCVYQFLVSALENHENVDNIVCMARYLDTESYCRKSKSLSNSEIPICVPEKFNFRTGQIEFFDDSKSYSYLKHRIQK